MLNKIYRIAPSPVSKRKKLSHLLSVLTNWIYPVYCAIRTIKNEEKDENIIISLTSFPARINTVFFCIQSLLRQTHPTNVILYLASSDFPDKQLPNSILSLVNKGLSIRFVDDDLKSYKKFFYAAFEHNDKIIITVDDDVLYPETFVENLLRTYEENKKCIVCYRAHQMTFHKQKLCEYDKWVKLSPGITGPSRFLVAIGVGGILYPPYFFKENDLKEKIFKTLAPTADDLWLKAIELKNGYNVIKVSELSKEWFEIRNSQKISLRAANNRGAKLNGDALKMLEEYYGISEYLKNKEDDPQPTI